MLQKALLVVILDNVFESMTKNMAMISFCHRDEKFQRIEEMVSQLSSNTAFFHVCFGKD